MEVFGKHYHGKWHRALCVLGTKVEVSEYAN